MKRLLTAAVLALIAMPVLAQDAPPLDARFTSLVHTNSTAGTVAATQTDLTAVADVAGSLAGANFLYSDALDAHKYVAWYKVSGTGTAPVLAGRTAIEIDITTGDTATTVATTSRTTLAAGASSPYVTVTGATTHIILTNNVNGASTAVADGSPATTFTITPVVVGASGSAAISPSSVVGNLVGWQVCNNGVNTSTWLAVGSSSDPTVEGVRLGKGSCYNCMNCTAGLLKAAKVAAQAASNGYAVIQFKQ